MPFIQLHDSRGDPLRLWPTQFAFIFGNRAIPDGNRLRRATGPSLLYTLSLCGGGVTV